MAAGARSDEATDTDASRRAMSMGVSTGSGRGCVAKIIGKPITPATTSTAAPIRRWRARVRACWTASTGSFEGAAFDGAAFGASPEGRFKNDNNPMRCWFRG